MSPNSILFSFLLAVLFSVSSARDLSHSDHRVVINDVIIKNYTIVCNMTRFSTLGLNSSTLGYCDKSLPYPVRAKDLVDRMTLTEKVQQLGNTASGVARLGLPPYEWWNEALHGVSSVGPGGPTNSFFDSVVPGATGFPVVILSTASFNESLWKAIGQAVSTEARAMHNLGRTGLTFWSPNVNVARDPRWGRITETSGEDPFVIGKYAKNFVRGLQDVAGTENHKDLNTRPLKVASCCKHYAGYDLDHWQGFDRVSFNAQVREQDMVETFLKPFEMCVMEGDVTSVMCSYNQVNGFPTCADPILLKDTIRGKWGLHGYIVSDCDSVSVIVDQQKWLGYSYEDASARSIKAGLDLDCGATYNNSLANSVAQGKVAESSLDESLINLYVVLMRLGFFDDSPQFSNLGRADICSAENIELATEAARQGIVLLKNEKNVLPLDNAKYKKLAIVGPHANATIDMIGNYAGVPCKYTSPFKAFANFGEVIYAAGCKNIECKTDILISEAVEASQTADATLLFVGLNLIIEAEGLDRNDLLLPGFQTQLINAVTQGSKGPVILVVLSAGGVDISFARDESKIPAIIWVGFPGEEGGKAIADIVFGKYNPGGRLPLTWYRNDYIDKFPLTSMQLRPDLSQNFPGRTYKFFNGWTVFPFGHGLSYTTFNYTLATPARKISIPINLGPLQHCRDLAYGSPRLKPQCPSVNIDDLPCNKLSFNYNVTVANVGDKDGSEVVIVYSKPPLGIDRTHFRQVVAFSKVAVVAGKSQTVTFQLDVCKSLSIVDSSGYTVLPGGLHTLVAGNDQVPFVVEIKFGGSTPL